MVHGHGIAAPTDFTPAAKGRVTAGTPVSAPGRWRRLDADRRLQLVDRVLRTSDGLVDEYSLAL